MRHSLGAFLRFNDYLFVDLLESNFGKRAMYLCVNYVIVYVVERNSGGHLAIVGKAFLQFLAGEEDTALYGAKGQVHVFGYLAGSYTHFRAHETASYLVCRLLLEKK